MKSLISTLAGFLLTSAVSADWQFVSRPDLAPPKLNITIPATEEASPGYLFVAPFSGYPEGTRHGPLQSAPYIFTDKGELVWSGFTYFAGWPANFQKGRYRGQDVLFSFEGVHNAAYGHGHGHTTFLNQRYETIKELRAANHRLTDKHEFHIVNETTGLIQIYHPVPIDLSAYGGSSEQQWIVDAKFQELDIETGDLIFEWSSLEHVSPYEAILPLNPGQAGSGYNSSDAWDYFHINSVDKDDEGNYLISARDACAVYKINGQSGEIIWKLAGKNSTLKLEEGVDFCFQHHARYLSTSADGTKQIISLYDNSAHGTETGRGSEVHTYPYSTGKIIEVDTAENTARLIKAYVPPDGLLSKSQGSTQVLPDGNVIVNWGSEGAVTEYTAGGKPIFHAYMDSGELGVGVQNYRAFKYEWHGYPREEPSVVSLVSEDDTDPKTTIYVSWNGDTETKTWRFYSVDTKSGTRELLGEAKRTGFETSFEVAQPLDYVQAEAIDAHHRVLRKSTPSNVKSSSKNVSVKTVDNTPIEPECGHSLYAKLSQLILGYKL